MFHVALPGGIPKGWHVPPSGEKEHRFLLCVRLQLAIVRFSYQMPEKPVCNAVNILCGDGEEDIAKVLFPIFFN